MKSCIFFIILGFLQFVYCSSLSNVTGEDAFPVCPVKLSRRKRANGEYTRWRSNVETSPEFIVKVLDEDITFTTSHANQVVAVNILPVTKRGEKIIIGAMVPPPSTTPSTEVPREYTRFVPPTSVPVTRVDEDVYLAPIPNPSRDVHGRIPPKLHELRDESPPASPQFLARTPPAPGQAARQFAPIAPVAFARKPTPAPMTPPFLEHKNVMLPTRTMPANDMIMPMRTVHKEFPIFQPFPDEINTNGDFHITRTSVQDIPLRTMDLKSTSSLWEDNEHFLPTTKKTDFEGTRFDANMERDSELSHRNMFVYNEDYRESGAKKGEKEFEDNGYEETDIFDKEVAEVVPPDIVTETGNKSESELHAYSEDDQVDEIDKSLNKTTAAKLENVDSNTFPAGEVDRNKRGPICSLLTLRQLNFNAPRTLPEIVVQLKKWAEDSPVARWIDITDGNFTTMENPIYMMIVDDPSSGQIISAKQTVMMVAGIQGRDHHAVAAAMYLLYQLIERSEAHADLLSKYRFWIIPVFNPDGYDYSMTFLHRREWTKNLRQSWDTCKGRESCRQCATYGLRCTVQPCYGVNLDRNFEYQWIPTEELRSEHPCGTLYAGTRQLSEPETRALTHFLHDQRTPLFTFIAFKEGDVLGVMYPYSHTRKKRAFDRIYRQRASRAAAAAYSITGRPYVAGQTSEFLPLYAGGIEDWVDGHLGIDNTYTIMMFRPTDAYSSKLITERVVHEAYAAMDTLLLQSLEPMGPPVVPLEARGEAFRALPDHTAILLPILSLLYRQMEFRSATIYLLVY